MGEFQWESGQDKAKEGNHHGEVDNDVKGAKSAIHLAPSSGFMCCGKKIPFALNSRFSQKSFLHHRKEWNQKTPKTETRRLVIRMKTP